MEFKRTRLANVQINFTEAFKLLKEVSEHSSIAFKNIQPLAAWWKVPDGHKKS
jgi:hypothetical protein